MSLWSYALLFEVFSVLIFATAMFVAKKRGLDRLEGSDLRLNEWHHGYLGVTWFALGSICLGASTWRAVAWFFIVLGVVVSWDDAMQHAAQTIYEDVKRTSPLHRLYGWLYARSALIRRVNAWLDRLLGS